MILQHVTAVVDISQNKWGTSARDARFSPVKSLHVTDSLSGGGWSCRDERLGAEEEGKTIFFPATCHNNVLGQGYGLEDMKQP